jgi:hypothetical protein
VPEKAANTLCMKDFYGALWRKKDHPAILFLTAN